jgi:hypothetical protein
MQDNHAPCSDLSCDNKEYDSLGRNNENYNLVGVEVEINYCPKIFIKIGMEKDTVSALWQKHRIMDMSYTQDVYMSHGTEYNRHAQHCTLQLSTL